MSRHAATPAAARRRPLRPARACRPTRAPRRSRSPGAASSGGTTRTSPGPSGLELAKRINVAHDWLSDPALRARYDRERGLRHGIGPRATGTPWRRPRRRRPPPPHRRRPPRRAVGTWTRPTLIARFLDRVAALTPTEIDRLALAEPPPIAFGATIRRSCRPSSVPPSTRSRPRSTAACRPGRTVRRSGTRSTATPRSSSSAGSSTSS